MDAKQRLTELYDRIAKAEKEGQRPEKSVDLIAVAKNFPSPIVQEFIEQGHFCFGENKVQEAKEKYRDLKKKYQQLCLHLIGPLQSNKAKDAVEIFDSIHSVDRPKIAQILAQEMQRQGKNIPCYVQVNTGMEPQKSGIDPLKAVAFVEQCQKEFGLNIIGLMCVPPCQENPGPHFALLYKLAHEAGLSQLSMGMSHDFETAIALGATTIRVGSLLFGARK